MCVESQLIMLIKSKNGRQLHYLPCNRKRFNFMLRKALIQAGGSWDEKNLSVLEHLLHVVDDLT